MPFAVIDFETTGLVPERTDRVVEIGVVLTDDDGLIEHEWTTLINPHRDVGATHIHRIDCGDVVDARFRRQAGIPVIDADLLVKNIYQRNETILFIQSHFPTVVEGKLVQFKKLREIVFNNETAKKLIEDFIYALMPDEFKHAFYQFDKPSLIVYDVPLLFEKQLHQHIDLSVCVYSPKESQIERVLKRDQIGRALAENIISKQIDIEEKRRLSDFCLKNTGTLEELTKNFQEFIKIIT